MILLPGQLFNFLAFVLLLPHRLLGINISTNHQSRLELILKWILGGVVLISMDTSEGFFVINCFHYLYAFSTQLSLVE